MNREQAEKWIADNKKKPYKAGYWSVCPGKYSWAVMPKLNFTESLPNSLLVIMPENIKGWDTEEEAIEAVIQALMKRPDEPEVDVEAIFKQWMGASEEYLPLYHHMRSAFIAGFEAAKRGEG